MNINRAFEIGGASLSEKTVEQLFNIRIHRVAVVDFAGFTKLIDAIGGITLNVEEEFNEKYNVHPPYQLVESHLMDNKRWFTSELEEVILSVCKGSSSLFMLYMSK